MSKETTRITLRSVDKRLKQLIVQGAQKRKKSINQFVLDTLSESLGRDVKQKPWLRYFGRMPKNAFEQSVFDDFKKIDKNMWQ